MPIHRRSRADSHGRLFRAARLTLLDLTRQPARMSTIWRLTEPTVQSARAKRARRSKSGHTTVSGANAVADAGAVADVIAVHSRNEITPMSATRRMPLARDQNDRTASEGRIAGPVASARTAEEVATGSVVAAAKQRTTTEHQLTFRFLLLR